MPVLAIPCSPLSGHNGDLPPVTVDGSDSLRSLSASRLGHGRSSIPRAVPVEATMSVRIKVTSAHSFRVPGPGIERLVPDHGPVVAGGNVEHVPGWR
jgi:hypothetical protein